MRRSRLIRPRGVTERYLDEEYPGGKGAYRAALNRIVENAGAELSFGGLSYFQITLAQGAGVVTVETMYTEATGVWSMDLSPEYPFRLGFEIIRAHWLRAITLVELESILYDLTWGHSPPWKPLYEGAPLLDRVIHRPQWRWEPYTPYYERPWELWGTVPQTNPYANEVRHVYKESTSVNGEHRRMLIPGHPGTLAALIRGCFRHSGEIPGWRGPGAWPQAEEMYAQKYLELTEKGAYRV